jgi:hypothetical protein
MIATFASRCFLILYSNGDIRRVAEKLFAMDVFTLHGKTTIVTIVHFAERGMQLQAKC